MTDRQPAAFVSVRLSPVARTVSFVLPQPGAPAPAAGEEVIVQGDLGPALGTIVPTIPAVADRRAVSAEDPHRVVRRATREDVLMRFKQQQREQEAYRVALIRIRERALPMKLTRVEQLFDGSRLIFYFTAEGRVDFRDLVRDLAASFRCRIEMRQIGVRDEAKMLGGFGSCGRPLCCSLWLKTFEPVSIKMAKQQELSLNPAKLSGLCGRLKCCLRNELPDGHGAAHGGCAHETGCGGCGGATAARNRQP